MTRVPLAAALFCALGFASVANAQQTRSTPLLRKDIPEFAGKEVAMSTVEYPAGVASAAHRHDAHTFVYVLEGEVLMAVDGKEPVKLGPGQTFYESPSNVHSTSKNASTTNAAKILVFMLKDKGKPATRPAN